MRQGVSCSRVKSTSKTLAPKPNTEKRKEMTLAACVFVLILRLFVAS